MFITKIYKMGRSGRLGMMLPKEVSVEPGEYEVEIKPVQPLEAPTEPAIVIPEPNPQSEEKPFEGVPTETQFGQEVVI